MSRQQVAQSQSISQSHIPSTVASSQGAHHREVPVPQYELKSDWKTFMNKFMEIMEANNWNEYNACLRLKLAAEVSEARELVEDVEDMPQDMSPVELSNMTSLGKVFREEFQEGKAKNLFLERTKQPTETFKKFYLDLCKLYRKAYPDKESVHNKDVADQFIFGCGNEDLSSYLWEQKRRDPLDLVELAESKSCFKQQYQLARRAAGNPDVADADLYMHTTPVRVTTKPPNRKAIKKLRKPLVFQRPQVTALAKTVAKSVADEFGARLSNQEFKSWRDRPYRGKGRGQRKDEGQAEKGQQESSKSGNRGAVEGQQPSTAPDEKLRRQPAKFSAKSHSDFLQRKHDKKRLMRERKKLRKLHQQLNLRPTLSRVGVVVTPRFVQKS